MKAGGLASKLGGFAFSLGLGGVASFLATPIILRFGGTDAFASIAAAQAMGSLLSVVVMFGWGVAGPATAARWPVETRKTRYLESLLARGILLLAALPVLAVLEFLIIPNAGLASFLIALSYASIGLGASWFFIGTRTPWSLFLFDALPRAITTLGAAAGFMFGADLMFFAVVTLIGYGAATVLPLLSLKGSISGQQPIRAVLAEQRHGALAAFASSSYLYLPMVIVNARFPAFAAVFGLADKLVKLASLAVSPLYQLLQGWVAEPDDVAERWQRIDRALAVAVGVAVIGAGAFLLGGGWASTILSGGTLTLTWQILLPFAVMLFSTLLTQVIGSGGLVAVGATRAVAHSSLAGAACCLLWVLLIFLAPVPSAAVSWMPASSELIVLLVQGWVLLQLRQRSSVVRGTL